MPTIDNPEMDDSIKEEIIQAQIKEIRDRSRIPTSEWRRRKYQNDVEWRNSILEKSPDLADIYPAPIPPENFIDEDIQRDRNMITSADILDLHLAELRDFKTFNQPGILSKRTEELTHKVAQGLAWGIAADEKNIVDERVKLIREELLKTPNTSEVLVVLHRFLSMVHSMPYPRVPVRDLYWQDVDDVKRFLDFLSRDLK